MFKMKSERKNETRMKKEPASWRYLRKLKHKRVFSIVKRAKQKKTTFGTNKNGKCEERKV